MGGLFNSAIMPSSKRRGAPRGGGRKKRDAEEHQKQRRRALQAHHRATLASLFNTLKIVVCPDSCKTPAKWKILDHAKGFLREQEAYLSRLLLLKGTFLGNDNGPRNLEEVRDEYRNLYSHSSSTCRSKRQGLRWQGPDREEAARIEERSEETVTDESVPSQSSVSAVPVILEFEGYLVFYRQTVEMMVRCGVLGPGQTGLPAVSGAISGLWDSMSPERKAAYQSATPHTGPQVRAGLSARDPGPEPHLRASQADSQGATASSSSTYEEELLQDAYDVVKKEMDPTSADSDEAVPPQCGGYTIYMDIMGFVKTQMSEKPECSQNLCLTGDDHGGYGDDHGGYGDDEIILSCSESFDSEDLM